jgi:hypothetical protein
MSLSKRGMMCLPNVLSPRENDSNNDSNNANLRPKSSMEIKRPDHDTLKEFRSNKLIPMHL